MFFLKLTHSLFEMPIQDKRHSFVVAIIQCISQSWKHMSVNQVQISEKNVVVRKHSSKFIVRYFFLRSLSTKRNYYYYFTKLYSAYFKRLIDNQYHTLNLAYKTVIRFIEIQKSIIYRNTLMKIGRYIHKV